MTFLELLKILFQPEPLRKPKVQDTSSKKTPVKINEEKEFIAMEIAEEDEDLFM